MHWTEYAAAMLLFSVVSMLLLYLLQRVQLHLPFNPQKLGGVTPEHLAWNTAASFTTNTNWQAYAGEATMSYFTQMAGLAYHNFISAATGIALAIAFIRGIARRQMKTIGNFWVDMVRSVLWVLLPFSIIGALLLVSQGVVQNLKPYDTAKLVEAQQVQHVNADGKPAVDAKGRAADTARDRFSSRTGRSRAACKRSSRGRDVGRIEVMMDLTVRHVVQFPRQRRRARNVNVVFRVEQIRLQERIRRINQA